MNPLRIVHCANFNEHKLGSSFYATDRKVSNGLIRNGHLVQDFSYRTIARHSNIFKNKKLGIKKVNNALIKCIENVEANILMLGHSELIHNQTLMQIKQAFPHIKIGMWWVDWVHNLKNVNLLERLEIIDHFFMTTDPIELKSINIPDSLLEKCSYFPNMCDPSFDIYKAFENKEYQHNLLFMGRYDKDREAFIDFLKLHYTDNKLGLYGVSEQSFLEGNKYLETVGSAKIAINYSRDNLMPLYSSGRIIQLAANGTMVMSPKIPDFTKIFRDDEIIYFDDFKDFKEKCDYYLKNDQQRIEIAQKSWKRAHSAFNNQKVTNFMLKSILDKNFSKSYIW